MNEIHTSLQKLLNGNEKCDDAADNTTAAVAADGQHDP